MSKCILIADDNQAIREYCRAAFEEEGYRVLLACNGREALELFAQHPPDVVVLDILMPVMTGLEALEQIRQRHAHTPVILFTAYDEDCVRDYRGVLATACVDKNEDLTELKRSVADALRSAATVGNRLIDNELDVVPTANSESGTQQETRE
jgi:CheY-like chemotaxis protein